MRNLKTVAYEAAKRYMRNNNKEARWNHMSNKEKVLFTYIRSMNEMIGKRIKLNPIKL